MSINKDDGYRKKIGTIIILVILLIAVAVIWNLFGLQMGDNDNDNKLVNGKTNISGEPKIKITPEVLDLGYVLQIKINRTVKIENVGNGSLVINGISTSCGCTTAVIVLNEKVKLISGLNNSRWNDNVSIEPGKSAELKITYNAGLHPDSGKIKRSIYIYSNDPASPEIKVVLTADVIGKE